MDSTQPVSPQAPYSPTQSVVPPPPTVSPAVPTPPSPVQPPSNEEPVHKRHVATSVGVVILILVVLAVISGGFWFFSTQKTETTMTEIPTPTPNQTPIVLEVTGPNDSDIVVEDKVIVKGQTEGGANVLITTADDAVLADVNSDGGFETEITLTPGINTITVSAYDIEGRENVVVMDVVYDEASAVLGKTDQKTSLSNKQPQQEQKKAVIGTVEKSAPNKLTLEEKVKLKSVETALDTNTKIIGKDNKTLKIQNVKKLDKAAIVFSDKEASGSATPSGKMKKALRIYIQSASESADLTNATGSAVMQQEQYRMGNSNVVHGVVEDNDGVTIRVVHQTQRDRVNIVTIGPEVEVKMKNGIQTIADIVPGTRVIVWGTRDESGNLVARKIFIVPGKAGGINKRFPVATGIKTVITGMTSPTATPSSTATPSAIPTEEITIEPTASPTLEI
jgi:hypothetical protein